MDYDPTYEPIVGGHKSFSLEKEMREQGRHASANDVGNTGDAYYEGPQGHPAPGSGSPRRDRLSASPARSHGATPALPVNTYGSAPPSYHGSQSPARVAQPASYISHSPPAQSQPLMSQSLPSQRMSSQPLVSQTPTYAAASPSPAPAANFEPRGAPNDPYYDPIVGGHKSYSWEKELRERGLHASANAVGQRGDQHFEGPQGHPAPGSGSPRRDRLSQSPGRGATGSPFVSDYARSTSPAPAAGHATVSTSLPPQTHIQPPPAYTATAASPQRTAYPVASQYSAPPAAPSVPAVSIAPLVGTNLPLPVSAGIHPLYTAPATTNSYPPATSTSPYRSAPYAAAVPAADVARLGSRSPSHAAVPTVQGDAGREYDPSYDPIIGGHKTHSWEKELRERGMHATANRVAEMGDSFFEGPQGHPAPGSGSPRRDRVSASPPRNAAALGSLPPY